WLIVWSIFRLADVWTQQGVRAVRDQVAGQPLSSSARGYLLDGARLFAAIDALRREHRIGPLSQMDREEERALPILRQQLGESAFSQAWAEGQAMDFEQTVEYALAITRDAASMSPTETGAAPAPPDPQLALLTPREREITTLVARGLANREIAAQLVLA